MYKPKIIAIDNGFTTITGKAIDTVTLDKVNAMIAYKLDELTTDLVCCDVVTGHGDGEQTWTIHEELPGFDAVMVHFETLPGFDRKWRDEIISPAFATNRTIIYARTASA